MLGEVTNLPKYMVPMHYGSAGYYAKTQALNSGELEGKLSFSSD
jgi:hypothetical protein